MSYAIWIALAVVLIAIGPGLVRNLRNAGKRGSGTDSTGAGAGGTSSSARDESAAADGDNGAGAD